MRWLLTVACLIIIHPAWSGHLIGGEISYECLGGNRYVVSLKMYRDCNAFGPMVATSFDKSVNISIYRAIDNTIIETLNILQPKDSAFVPLILDVPCMENPPDICVVGMNYRDTIELVIPPGGIHLVNQRCCRTPNALNIINPSDFGSTYHAFIPDSSVAICNSSPTFNQVPPIVLCTQLYLELDYSATDRDGDSLVYSMCTPYHGAGSGGGGGNPAPAQPAPPPFSDVVWTTGFSAQYQIPAAPAFEIDSATGIIYGRPVTLGTYVFAVKVEEYRNGQLIGENRRDFQMTTVFCEVEAAAAIDSALEECIGQKIQFFNVSTLGKHFKWDFGDTATIDDTASSVNPVYTYPDTGVYNIQLIAFGDICSDTTNLLYHVKPKLSPEFSVPPPECLDNNSFGLKSDGFYYASTHMKWQLGVPGVRRPIRLEQDSITFSGRRSGTFPITLTYSDFKCEKSFTDSITILPNPDFELVTRMGNQCIPFSFVVTTNTFDADLPSYRWSFNGDTAYKPKAKFELDSSGVYDLWVELKTDSGCIDTITKLYEQHVLALDTPQAMFSAFPPSAGMYEPYFELFDESIDAKSIRFLVDDSLEFKDPYVSLNLPDTGYHEVALIARHENGCKDTTYQFIRTEPVYQFWAPNAFTPDANGINERWQTFVYVSKSFEIHVMDRWGRPVFITNDPNYSWDGTKFNEGEPCPMGSYSYNVSIIDNKDREWHYDGIVTLLR